MIDPLPDHRLSLKRIETAATSIDPVFTSSRQFIAAGLSERLGCQVMLKDETDNPIGSFKGRGADFFLTAITARGDTRQLVCASTGNFGQAMAWAATRRGRSVIVYADVDANSTKMGRIGELGGEVRLVGRDFDAAKDAARDFCHATAAWMVEDGREPEISEGAGTIGIEMLNGPCGDTLLIPVGNGALINGIARWVKAAAPQIRVIGVSAEGADAMERSWRGSEVVERPTVSTIAEGIAVRTPVPEAVADMRPLVDEMIVVSDTAMIEGMRLIHETTGMAVEPSAAAGVAAILQEGPRFAGMELTTVLTGKNLTEEQRTEWLG